MEQGSVPLSQPVSAPPTVKAPAREILEDDSSGTIPIVLLATADSYIVIKTVENKILFSQLMRPGDSYEVPSGAGLLLETGNAGGLKITVGGKQALPLGTLGEIRRDILLEARSLLRRVN